MGKHDTGPGENEILEVGGDKSRWGGGGFQTTWGGGWHRRIGDMNGAGIRLEM